MSNGSSVIVGRMVGVFVGNGVFVTFGVPVEGVVVGACVLMTNRSGVKVAGKPNGVAVGAGELVCVGDRKERESGSAEHPARRAVMMVVKRSLFMKHLQYDNREIASSATHHLRLGLLRNTYTCIQVQV
jgi:hypothetical protein